MNIKDRLYNVRHNLMNYIVNESREYEQMKFHYNMSDKQFAITFNTEEDLQQWQKSNLHYLLRSLSTSFGNHGYTKFIQYDFYIPEQTNI